MFGLKEITVLLLLCAALSTAEGSDNYHHHTLLSKELEGIKSHYDVELEKLRLEMVQLRADLKAHHTHPTRHSAGEDHSTKEWAQKAMGELRVQMKEVSKKVDSSGLLKQLQFLNNNMKNIVTQNEYCMSIVRSIETRADNLEDTTQRLHYDKKNLENMIGEIRLQLSSLSKQVKHKLTEVEDEAVATNNVAPAAKSKNYRHRHSKAMNSQLTRLHQAQDKLQSEQQNVQAQISAHQRRLDHLEEANWQIISAKIDFLEIQGKSLNERLGNNSAIITDVEKMHSSILELREDLESVENKMDKTIPEFRKEISKLDVDQAQTTAHISYMKQDQENIRQSVKAIAVSMSNTQDRAATNRDEIRKVDDVVRDLQQEVRQHFYKLNDHILKSEANVVVPDANLTDSISLPELMGEVKELQPVEREYQDLVAQLPKDCSYISGTAGSYIIHTGLTGMDTANVWCSDGKTLVQRRYNGSTEFNRKYIDYIRGFGDSGGEYWLGLEIMHRLTRDNCTSMRIDMTDIYGAAWYARYELFYVGSADTGYMLDVGGFDGNASDAFEYQNHMEFSTIDRDRDISNTHCAANYEGGWWFSHCQHVNINGRYSLGLTWFDSNQNEWIAVATSEMHLFRRSDCNN